MHWKPLRSGPADEDLLDISREWQLLLDSVHGVAKPSRFPAQDERSRSGVEGKGQADDIFDRHIVPRQRRRVF